MKKWLGIHVLSLLLPGHFLFGQSNGQMWFEYMLNYPFANMYNIELAGTYSTALQDPRWRAFDVAVTPEWSVTRHIDLQGAVLISNTFQDQSLSTFELREMLGARFHFTPDKRILTRLLLRFEQRNMQNTETKEWEHSTRTRVRAETVIPINKPTMFSGDQLWYAIVDAEAFIVMDQDVEERYANRVRVRAGIGYRINYNWRLEFMYTWQNSRNTIDSDFNSTADIFRFRVKQYLRKSKPAPVTGNGN